MLVSCHMPSMWHDYVNVINTKTVSHGLSLVMACTLSSSSSYLTQEGPHSALNEDEFFDALEMAYREDELEVVKLFMYQFR